MVRYHRGKEVVNEMVAAFLEYHIIKGSSFEGISLLERYARHGGQAWDHEEQGGVEQKVEIIFAIGDCEGLELRSAR